MARGTFSASNFLRHGAGIVTAAPLTMAAWCWTTITNATQTILWLGQASEAGAAARDQFILGVTSAAAIRASTGDNTNSSQAASSTTYSASTWFHAAAVFDVTTGTDRAAFLNGGGKGTNTTNRTPGGISRTSIGLVDNTFATQPWGGAGTGYIALPAIWDTNLADAEIALLAAGIPPWCVRPGNLVACWPMLDNVAAGDEMNFWPGGYLMSEQGTLPVAPHNPPVALPFPWMRPVYADLDLPGVGGAIGVGRTRSPRIERVRLAA